MSKIDHSELLRGAARLRSTWSLDSAMSVARAIASQARASVDWDDAAGEEWAAVLADDGVKAYVCVRMPLIVLIGDVAASNLEYDVIRLHVEHADSPEIVISHDAFAEAFPHALGAASEAAAHPISANDLYFLSV